jgi:hypothetical protein
MGRHHKKKVHDEDEKDGQASSPHDRELSPPPPPIEDVEANSDHGGEENPPPAPLSCLNTFGAVIHFINLIVVIILVCVPGLILYLPVTDTIPTSHPGNNQTYSSTQTLFSFQPLLLSLFYLLLSFISHVYYYCYHHSLSSFQWIESNITIVFMMIQLCWVNGMTDIRLFMLIGACSISMNIFNSVHEKYQSLVCIPQQALQHKKELKTWKKRATITTPNRTFFYYSLFPWLGMWLIIFYTLGRSISYMTWTMYLLDIGIFLQMFVLKIMMYRQHTYYNWWSLFISITSKTSLCYFVIFALFV